MCVDNNCRTKRQLHIGRVCAVLVMAGSIGVWLSGGFALYRAEAAPQNNAETTTGTAVKKTAQEESETRVLFDQDAPALVANEIEKSKLMMHAPKWSTQLLEYPSAKTIDAYRGKASPAAVREATLWLERVLKPQYLPKEIPSHLIPLKSYAVLYSDWVDHGGSDAFLLKYRVNNKIVQILEAPNYVLIACKDVSQKDVKPAPRHVEHALEMASQILQKELVARNAERVGLLEMPKDVTLTAGYWEPNINLEKLKAAQPGSYDTDILSDSVRFCTNGDVVAFQIFKYIWTTTVENPFAPRFGVLVDTRSDERLFAMLEEQIKSNPALDTAKKRIEFLDRVKDRLVMRQAEEYLGPLLYDYEGNKITAHIPFKSLEAAVSSLNDDQKVILVNQRMIDEYYISGLKAFNEKDYQDAIANWTQALQLDPLNVRVAILLQIALDFRQEQIAFAGEAVVKKDPSLVSAREAIQAHRRNVLKRRIIEKEEALTSQEIAAHQIKAIDYYTEGHFADAIREWDEVLKIDPTNARALLFREMAIGQLKKARKE